MHSKNPISCSICVSTYNRPAALRLCLQSILSQSYLPQEIIIGDDGSGQETAALIDDFKKKSPVEIVHVWQPDEGYRLASCRNKSFAKASSEYIIQIDGDLILQTNFIEDHIKKATPGTFICGTRVLLTPGYTDEVIENSQFLEPSLFSKSISKRYNAIRNSFLSKVFYRLQRSPNQYKYVLGANMSFYKKDLLKVNGYNEKYSGWGKEDNDLAIRLINAGTSLRVLKFSGIIFHLFHAGEGRHKLKENEDILKQTIANNVTFVPDGISSYLNRE